jgi:hypothetical protein
MPEQLWPDWRPSTSLIRSCVRKHLDRLRSAGIDLAVAEQTGCFEPRNWDETAISIRERMLALIQEGPKAAHSRASYRLAWLPIWNGHWKTGQASMISSSTRQG